MVIMAAMVGMLAPVFVHYVEKMRAANDQTAMRELCDQLYKSSAVDTGIYDSIPDPEGQPFTKEEGEAFLTVCPETGGTLYQRDVAKFLGTDEIEFESSQWIDSEFEIRVYATGNGIRIDYSDTLEEMMGAENLRYQ